VGRSAVAEERHWFESPDGAEPVSRQSLPLSRFAPSLSLLCFLTLATLLFLPAWQAPFTRAIGDGTDAGIFSWYLRWPAFAFSHGLNPLVSNYLDYPDGINLMWNVSIPALATLMTPITLTLGPVFAYNALLTLGVGLSGWTAFLAIRRYVSNPAAAGVGALLYAFSPYVLGQAYGHLHVAIVFIPPLLFMVLDDIVIRNRRPPVRSGALLGALAAVQLLISEEVLATSALTALLGLILLTFTFKDQLRLRAVGILKALLVAAGTMIAVDAFPLWMQFFGPQRMSGSLQPTLTYSTDVLNFLLPTRLQELAPPPAVLVTSHFTGNLTEWNAYLGLPLLAVVALTAVRFWHRPLVRIAIGVGLLFALLSLGPVIHVAGWVTRIPVVALALLFPFLRRVLPFRVTVLAFVGLWLMLTIAPLFHNILPSRLMLPVYLLAGIVLAIFTEWVSRLPRDGRWLGLSFALLAVFFTMFPHVPYPASAVSIPQFFGRGGDVSLIPEGSVSLVLPYARGDQPTAMQWQAVSGMRFRMPEGYAYVPAPIPALASPPPSATQSLFLAVQQGHHPQLTQALRTRVLTDLHDWRVSSVIVGPMAHQEDAVALVTALFERQPRFTQGVFLWSSVETGPDQAAEPLMAAADSTAGVPASGGMRRIGYASTSSP
jgi:hypothetical protein